MNIELAEVKSNADIFEMGTFYVTNKNNDLPFKVYYTTPYYAGRSGGFIAVPEVGSKVLICRPDGENSWYYLGSTLNFGLAQSMSDPAHTPKEKGVNPDNKMYRARGVPQRYVFKSPKGNALILSDEYNPDYFNVKAELRSAAGKALKLIDSPKVDCIILENEHGDRLKISSGGNDATSPRSIELECMGTVNIITKGSNMNLIVVDGKELNITNTSTGSKRANANDPTPGNINITSENSDINLTVKSDTGTIFMDAQGNNGHVVLQSKGQIDIIGEKGVNITANSGDTNIKGTKINLN